MENKKEEWLYEEFGIKVDNRYLCIPKQGSDIIGQILNFSPSNSIVIKAEEGLHILPYKEILELRPLPVKEEKFKVGDVLRVIEDFFIPIYGKGFVSAYPIKFGTKLVVRKICKNEIKAYGWGIRKPISIKINDVQKYCRLINIE